MHSKEVKSEVDREQQVHLVQIQLKKKINTNKKNKIHTN